MAVAVWSWDASTFCIPAPHSPSHHYQCRTPYAAVHTIVLLVMGIMMPETCWDSLIINIKLVVSCWFLSLHPKFMMHGHKSLKQSFFKHKRNLRVCARLGILLDLARPWINNNLTCKECPKPVSKESDRWTGVGWCWPRVIYMFLIMFTRYFHIIRHEDAVMLHNELFIASGMVTTA